MIKETPLMTETAVENEQAEQVVEAPSSAVSDEQLVTMLVDRARNDGASSFFRISPLSYTLETQQVERPISNPRHHEPSVTKRRGIPRSPSPAPDPWTRPTAKTGAGRYRRWGDPPERAGR